MPPLRSATPPNSTPDPTTRLLRRAHSPTTTTALHASKIAHKPLLLHRQPATASLDARARRRALRASKPKPKAKANAKPRPLSAAERRRGGLHRFDASEADWETARGLWRLWCAYVRGILGVGVESGGGDGRKGRGGFVTPAQAGPLIGSADMHGALVEVVRSRCVSRVGVRGVVVREGKFAFVVVNREGRVLTVPKEHTVFRVEVPLVDDEEEGEGKGGVGEGGEEGGRPKPLVFEIHGSQFENRPPERATKKFKMRIPPDL